MPSNTHGRLCFRRAFGRLKTNTRCHWLFIRWEKRERNKKATWICDGGGLIRHSISFTRGSKCKCWKFVSEMEEINSSEQVTWQQNVCVCFQMKCCGFICERERETNKKTKDMKESFRDATSHLRGGEGTQKKVWKRKINTQQTANGKNPARKLCGWCKETNFASQSLLFSQT